MTGVQTCALPIYQQRRETVEIRLSRDELLEVACTVLNVVAALKLAYTLFFMDNSEDMRRFPPSVESRDEAEFLNFAAALATQGFEIVEYDSNLRQSRLVVRDVSNLEPDRRRFHASQFLFHVWLLSRSDRVLVEYREKDGTPNLLVSAGSEICERIDRGEEEPLALATKMEIVDLRTNAKFAPVGDK